MLAFCFVDSKSQHILTAIDVVRQHDVDCYLLDATFRAQGNINTVYESERIERLQRASTPAISLFHDTIRDMGNLLMRHLESIDVLDGGGDVPLAHATCIHSKHLVFDGRGIPLILLNNLRFKCALAIAGDTDRRLAQRSLDDLAGVAVAGVAACSASVLLIAKMDSPARLSAQPRTSVRKSI